MLVSSTDHKIPLSAFERLTSHVLAHWPEHRRFLELCISHRSPESAKLADHIASLIERLADGHLDQLVSGYQWVCNMIVEEELVFRRTGRYRYARFEEVERIIYNNKEIMDLYMDGVLLSQALYNNHLHSMEFYINEFIPKISSRSKHLEIGPGHGLFLYFAASKIDHGSISAWDVSNTSLSHTRSCLDKLGINRPVTLSHRNLFEEDNFQDRYDSIVISEVLEHLEDPARALNILHNLTESGGHIFINFPVNAPCIDHLFLLKSPEDVVNLVEGAGFTIKNVRFSPVAGYTLERARKARAAVSCVVIGQKKENT